MSRVATPSRSLLITALLAAGASSGCGSLALGKGEFGCEGYPSHPMCLPTSAVYALTESSEPIQSADEAPEHNAPVKVRKAHGASSAAEPTSLELFMGEATRAGREQAPMMPDREVPPSLADGPEPVADRQSEDLLLPRSTDPLPLRLPAQVMRIWLAPWEDERGDLHATGYVYTEIAPRTWSLAEGPTRFSNAQLRPLQVAERQPASAGRAQPGVRSKDHTDQATVPGATDRIPPVIPTPRSQP